MFRSTRLSVRTDHRLSEGFLCVLSLSLPFLGLYPVIIPLLSHFCQLFFPEIKNRGAFAHRDFILYRGFCLILANRRGYLAGVGLTFRSTITA